MSQARKMICPDCGAEVNHHAVKIDYGVDAPAFIDWVFGGEMKEAQACPKRGRTKLRAA